MKKILCALSVCLLIAGIAQADVIGIDDMAAGRAVDGTDADGLGDEVSDGALDVGIYVSDTKPSPVFVFQMTGLLDPLSITNADFSVSQSIPESAINFDVSAHVIRTSSSSTINASDYETSALKLMDNFDNDSHVGSVSLNASGETALTTWLQNNWSDGDYVFIGLKSDLAGDALSDVHRLARYGNSAGGWTADSTDAQLSVSVIPEPATLGMLGLGGITLLLIRRKLLV